MPETDEQTQLDQELIEIAKKHGVDEAFQIIIPLDDAETIETYVKYPTLNAYSIGMTLEDRNPLKGKLILLTDMYLEGDKRMLEPEKSTLNLKIFLRACTAIDRIVDLKNAIIKKKSTTTL